MKIDVGVVELHLFFVADIVLGNRVGEGPSLPACREELGVGDGVFVRNYVVVQEGPSGQRIFPRGGRVGQGQSVAVHCEDAVADIEVDLRAFPDQSEPDQFGFVYMIKAVCFSVVEVIFSEMRAVGIFRHPDERLGDRRTRYVVLKNHA